MEYTRIPLSQIVVSDNQPREDFDEKRLRQLADSIDEVGQLQPIIVKKEGDKFQLISGERRYRAIKKDDKKQNIAAVVLDKNLDDQKLRQIQLVENIQRQDLNPLERAKSIQQFIEDNDLTKKEASKKLGIPRTTMTEWLNILEVDEFYQKQVLDEDSPLSLSHITLAHSLSRRTGDPVKQKELLNGIIKYKLSRSETKDVINLFYDYLHMSMEEALKTILIRREQQKMYDRYQEEKKEESDSNPVKSLINTMNKTGEKLEKVMTEVNKLEEGEEATLLDQFLYIYQMLEIIIPAVSEKSVEDLIDEIKQENIN
ncbi:MAG: ParB/RepB/Spo0J family partition protein [Halanaerobiales bacterium]